MSIQQWSKDIWVVKLAKEPALSEDLMQVRDQASVAARVPHMVIDLAGLDRINSTNLAQLLRLRKLAIENDVKLRLAGPMTAVWAVFLTTGLDKVFEFSADLPSALAQLQMDR